MQSFFPPAFGSATPGNRVNTAPQNDGSTISPLFDSTKAFMNYGRAEGSIKPATVRLRRGADTPVDENRRAAQLIPKEQWDQQVEKVANGYISVHDAPLTIEDILAVFRNDEDKIPTPEVLKDFLRTRGVSEKRLKSLAWKYSLNFSFALIKQAIAEFKDKIDDQEKNKNINKPMNSTDKKHENLIELKNSANKLADHLSLRTIPFVYKQDFDQAFHPDLNTARWRGEFTRLTADIQKALRDQDSSGFAEADLKAWKAIRALMNDFCEKVKSGPQNYQLDKVLNLPDCRFIAMSLLNPTNPDAELARQIARADLRGIQITA